MRVLIAGGGISGLSLAWWLRAAGGDRVDVTVLEAQARPGGKIWTDHAEGYLCESGVNGFLDNKPRTLELARALCLNPVRAAEGAKKRFIYSGGRLHRLPESPPAFLGTGLMSFSGKLRVLAEPFIPRGGSPEETLADFARRRLGAEALDKLIDPMASGVFAGDPEDMNLLSCFPRIYDIEQKYGGLVKGMFKLMAERKKGVGAGPGGKLTSFASGMQGLTDALATALGPSLRTSTTVSSIEKTSGEFNVYLQDGGTVRADRVVLAMPAFRASEVIREIAPEVSRVLAEIPYPSLSVVCTGFESARVNVPLEGFGFLVPFKERRKVLGTLFDSNVYPGRAPEGRVLLRSMVGGARASSIADMEDGKLLDTVLSELADITGLRAEPDLVRVYRHERAMPQYTAGHRARLDAIEGGLGSHPGLYLSGNALRGIGVNDCVENSHRLASQILEDTG